MSNIKFSPSAPLDSRSSFGSDPLVDSSRFRPKTSETEVVIRTVRGPMAEARKRIAKCSRNLGNDISYVSKTSATNVKHQRSSTSDIAASRPEALCIDSGILPPPADTSATHALEANMRDGCDLKPRLSLSEKMASNLDSKIRNEDIKKSHFASISNIFRAIKNPLNSELTLSHQNRDNVPKEIPSNCNNNAGNTTNDLSHTCESSFSDAVGVQSRKDGTVNMNDSLFNKWSGVTKQEINLPFVNKCKLQMATIKQKQTCPQNMTKDCVKFGLVLPRKIMPKVQYSQKISNLPSNFNKDESSKFLEDFEDAAEEHNLPGMKIMVYENKESQEEDLYKDTENTRTSFSGSTSVPGKAASRPSGVHGNTVCGSSGVHDSTLPGSSGVHDSISSGQSGVHGNKTSTPLITEAEHSIIGCKGSCIKSLGVKVGPAPTSNKLMRVMKLQNELGCRNNSPSLKHKPHDSTCSQLRDEASLDLKWKPGKEQCVTSSQTQGFVLSQNIPRKKLENTKHRKANLPIVKGVLAEKRAPSKINTLNSYSLFESAISEGMSSAFRLANETKNTRDSSSDTTVDDKTLKGGKDNFLPQKQLLKSKNCKNIVEYKRQVKSKNVGKPKHDIITGALGTKINKNNLKTNKIPERGNGKSSISRFQKKQSRSVNEGVYKTNWTTRIPFEDMMESLNSRKTVTSGHLHESAEERRRRLMKECYDVLIVSSSQSHRYIAKLIGQEIELENYLLELGGRDRTLEWNEIDAAKVKENKLLQDERNFCIAQNENNVHLRGESDDLRIKDSSSSFDFEIEEIESVFTCFSTPSINATTTTSTVPRFSSSNIFPDTALDESSATSKENVNKTTVKDSEGIESVTSLPVDPATADYCAPTCVSSSPAFKSRRGRKRNSGSAVAIDIPRTKKTKSYGKIGGLSEERAGNQVSGKTSLKPGNFNNSAPLLNKEKSAYLDNPASSYMKEKNEDLKGNANNLHDCFDDRDFIQDPLSIASSVMPDNVLDSLLLKSSTAGDVNMCEKYPEVNLVHTENKLNVSFTHVEDLINHDGNASSLSGNICSEECDLENYINQIYFPQSQTRGSQRRIFVPGSRDAENCNKLAPQECSVLYATDNNSVENACNSKGSKEMAEVDIAIRTANSDGCLAVDSLTCTSFESDSSVVIHDNRLHTTIEADIHCAQNEDVLGNLKEKEDGVTVKIQEGNGTKHDTIFPAVDGSDDGSHTACGGSDVHSIPAELPKSSAAYSDKCALETLQSKSISDSEDEDILSIYASSWTGIDSDAEQGKKDNMEYQKFIDPDGLIKDLGKEGTYSEKSNKMCLDQHTTKPVGKENSLDLCNDKESVCEIPEDAYCAKDLASNDGDASSDISCSTNKLLMGSGQICTRNYTANSGLCKVYEGPDKLDQVSSLDLNGGLAECKEQENDASVLPNITRECGQESNSFENGDKSIADNYSNMAAESKAEHTDSNNTILTSKTNLREFSSVVDILHTPHKSGPVKSPEKNSITHGENHTTNTSDYLSCSSDLMTKQPDDVNMKRRLHPRQGRPTGGDNSHCSLKSQKLSEQGHRNYSINFIPRPPNYNYCSRFIHFGVCYRPACLLQHKMTQELEGYLGELILHYIRSNLEREAWSLIDSHTSTREISTLLTVSLLKPLARHIVEMENFNMFSSIKVPSHLSSPLDIAKVETLCDFNRGQDAYRLLRHCYSSASLFGAELLISIFVRYCERCPEREATSPWEKILLWQYEEPGNPFEEKLKDLFNLGWMKVNINSRNVNRVCEAYSHLCRALSTPSMFFTSITCSVITFFNDIGQRKTSFWVLEEVRRLKANDASIFIALIPTDKESAMCVLHELSALSELVCELRVPLPTCTWDLLLTLINTQGNLTLTVNLLICAMQINFFRPEIDVLEKLLFDCSRSGPALLKPLSNLVCALSAEYLNRIKSSLHNLLSFLTHSPPPAQQIKHVIIRHCQGHGINLLPNSDVSGYEVHSEGGSNTDNLTQCSLGVHNGDGYITQYGILPGNHGSQHVHVSSGIRGFSSLENRISSGAFEYHTDRIKNNEDTQLFVGFGNGKDSNINKILPENSRYSNKNFMGNRSFTTKKISFESRSTTGGIYRQESCSREDRISRVYAYQHGVASTGPRVQNNTTYSSGINREESLALAGSGFQNQLISTTTSRHKDQLILPAPDYHSKSYTVNTGCQDQLKTQTEIPSLGLNSHKRSINLSHQNLPAVPVNKRGPSSGNHRWTVLSKREVELNRLGTKSSDFNVPQCQGSLDHTQTSVENKDSESMPGYSQTYKEPRCQESLLEDVAGVVSRHMSAPSNSTSHGSYINDDKQDRGKIPIYYSKNALYLKNRQQKLNVQQHIEECSPRGTGRSVQAQEGILQCSSENTRLHYGNNQSSSCSGIPMMRVPLPNAESKQLCSSVCESFSKMKTTGMSSELTSLGAQTDLITQNIEEGQTSCNREQSNVQNYVQTTAMINETDELPSHTASISKFKDGNCNLSCPVSDVIKEKCVLQRSVSKKYIQEKPVKVPKPCVSTISKPRELALPSGLMIDVDGCSYSPDAYRRSFSELEGNSDIVGDLRMIAGLNSERLKKIKLVKIFDLLTGKDAIHSVGANFAEILKSMTGISDERSQAFAPAEELIGRLGVSLMVECIEQCYPDQALCIIQSLHDHKIYFFSCVPINKKDPPSEHRLAVMALEVLHQMHNLKLFTVILEEIYWSGGTEDVKLRLNVLSKVLSSYLDSLACGSASISKETLRFITKILGSLVKYYQHDLHTIACEYHQIMDLSEFLKKAWEYSRSCEDEEANSELHHVICSSLECGVHLPPEVTHNLEHHGTDVTYPMNKSTQENEKIPHPQQNLSSNDHLKGPCEARRGDHLDVPDCINDSESRSIINFSSGTGGNVSVRTHYQDLRGAGNIKRGAIGTRSHSIQVTAKGDEAISNTNNTMEFNNETHHATKLMGGSRGRGRSGFFTTRNKRRKGRPWKGCRRPLMRPQISEW